MSVLPLAAKVHGSCKKLKRTSMEFYLDYCLAAPTYKLPTD